ncbi:peptidase S8 [Niastella yeongjuensis]|uniref:Peptidase S8 n=1 Tax=Niastella yeongjuensis TaxID=354355 RepID=A0A1V9E465_9BACT|nr:S8 family serine peptidase [Niastella yeongjuensis]OQP40898.1 peptidase S8 [Niastella yeongjuensis]SEO98487.1 Subtilase family protein [Niastella yeongjuensis]
MASKKDRNESQNLSLVNSSVDDLLLASLERGGDNLQTGRYLVTYKPGAAEEGKQSLADQGLRIADARDFTEQAITLESVGDADTIHFNEIGVALVSGPAAQERSMDIQTEAATDSAIESIDPEYFVFANDVMTPPYGMATEETPNQYLRGFLRAAEIIAKDLQNPNGHSLLELQEEVQVLGATWGLNVCKVPPCPRGGSGIKVAVLDTGMDLLHPDFIGRSITSQTFVGQPVQDLNGHGTHCIGTACGPKAPVGNIPRYGIGFKTSIYAGKVLTNTGTGTQAGVLAGMNWAIANRCAVISMSLGAPIGIQPSYTAAGQAALNNGCLIIAAAGNSSGGPTGAPGNSPTIMAVASLDQNLMPSSFSSAGKIDIAGPGRDIFSSWPRPQKYNTISGTSMATPHVAGCAALWAETSPNLRGALLWRKLVSTARHLSLPTSKVGAGLVQAL